MTPAIVNGLANGHSTSTASTNGYHTEGKPYQIPNITYRSPKNRRLKVIAIGAGVSGIQTAYHVQKHCENVDLQIYEKNANIGGTWLVNRYALLLVQAASILFVNGPKCDIPSHAYSLNFALNPEWPLFFSYAEDIQQYLEKVVDVFGLRKHMHFSHEVLGSSWDEEQGKWIVKIAQTNPDGSRRVFEDSCDLLLQCSGVLSRPKWPNIEGLEDFKGRVVHTGQWDDSYDQTQWKNDRVAVIGSGASSIQTVPTMQPHVPHMDIFVRTAVWFVKMADNYGTNHAYTEQEKAQFRSDKKSLAAHAESIEKKVNGDWNMFFSDSTAQEEARAFFKARMGEHIKDKRLLQGFTPNWAVGCRRVTPGDPYMKAIQEPNVDVHFTAVRRLTPEGVLGEDGIERKVDTVICATGYDVSYHPHFPVVGRGGLRLDEAFGSAPECYLGITIPDFPNYIIYGGPTWPVENGSALGPLLAVALYAVQIIKKMQAENVKSLVPRRDVTDKFNAHVQEFIKTSVWKEDCRSWYKDNKTGKVFAVWPGSSLHYMQTISSPRYEDYEITYHYDNLWAHLGYGFTEEDRDPEASTAPYLNADAIDDRWMELFTAPQLEKSASSVPNSV